MFQILTLIYRSGNFVYHHWICTSILSAIFLSIKILGINNYQGSFTIFYLSLVFFSLWFFIYIFFQIWFNNGKQKLGRQPRGRGWTPLSWRRYFFKIRFDLIIILDATSTGTNTFLLVIQALLWFFMMFSRRKINLTQFSLYIFIAHCNHF